MRESCDILIAGGGIAGMTAAAAFAHAGFDVICVDPAPPVTERDAEGADLRTTALLQPARALLQACGLWDGLAPHAMALNTMRIADTGGQEGRARIVREFHAAEISDQPFGWNLPNWLIRRELAAHLDQAPRLDFRPGTAATGLFTRTGAARVRLSCGAEVTARLVIAADGRESPMRAAAGIAAKTVRYGQKALAFAVTHAAPHDQVSTEIHQSGGPFTLVPLPDHDGTPSSGVVWLERGAKVRELAALPEDAFEAAMTRRSCDLYGPLKLASRRTVWPIISRHAVRMAGERLALMAEAAHVVPPIGAQGLNMSLADLRALLQLAESRPDGLGDAQMLEAYHRARIGDVRLRAAGIDLLNRASLAEATPVAAARAAGLNALHAFPPVRHALMRLGMGLER